MTFDLFMVWSNVYPSCCGNTGRLLHGICKYAGERIMVHGPLVFLSFVGQFYEKRSFQISLLNGGNKNTFHRTHLRSQSNSVLVHFRLSTN